MNKSVKLWDKMSKIYDQETSRLELINRKVIANTKKRLCTDDIVLEIGCGTGIFTIELADHVKKIYAADISPKMLGIAKAKAANRKIQNIGFSQSTVFDKNYKAESFDVILAYNVMLYFEDIPKTMKRINDLLKPGGLFISLTPCSKEKGKSLMSILKVPLLAVYVILKLGLVPLPKIKFFNVAELEHTITSGSFHLVETENLHGPEESYFIVAKKI